MFRALYDYKTDLKRYLSFQTGDQFTVLDGSQKDWFLAQNGFGEIGYIPKNYVAKDEVSESEVLRSIDRAIEVIHYEASSKGGQYSHTQRENLRKLIEHRENVVESYKAPVTSSQGQHVSTDGIQPKRQSARRAAPTPPTNSNKSGETTSDSTDSVREVTSIKGEQFVRSESSVQNYNTAPTLQTKHDSTLQQSQVNEKLTQSNLLNKPSVSKDVAQSSITTNGPSITTTDCATSPFPSPSKSRSFKPESSIVDCRTVTVPDHVGNDLVEEVRRNTGLSYKKSCVAVETVLGHIGLSIPDASELMDRIYKTIVETETESDVVEETSSDYERLCELFTQLTECKDDSQQRGWALHEDEQIITDNLEELLSILENAKPSVSRRALAVDSYEGIYNLVQYYQMENRVKLRLVLLRVFGAMCTLDSTVITMLLCSVLTTELAEELQQNIDDVQRSSYISLMLSMIFAMGEPVPANLHDHLNAAFLGFIFDTIETPPSSEHEDQVTDILVNFVLAFNLHFRVPKDNLVLQVIEEKKTVKVFTEKLLLLFNRDEDPVQMFDHLPKPVNSVMKILQDMYSRPGTSFILYTNDAKVLIDIILRHLIDLSPGDQQRSAHLKLMQLYLENADYMEHKHRYAELSECLHRIQVEEEDTGDDKHIVTYIFTHLNVFS